MPIQFVLILLSIVSIALAWRRVKQSAIPVWQAWLWSLLWIGVSIVAVQPETASVAAQFFGIGRGADLVIYTAIALVFVLVFRIFVAIETLNRKLTDIVRAEALRGLEGEDGSRSVE